MLLVGDPSGGGTPGPISNPAVKPARADGSIRATVCESRSLPTSSLNPSHLSFFLSCHYENYVSRAFVPYTIKHSYWLVSLNGFSGSRSPKSGLHTGVPT